MLKSFVMFRLFVFGLSWMCFLCAANASAASKKIKVVQIRKSNTMAYKEPFFDAQVLARLKKGQKLYALNKKIVGKDGFGLFYKVRLKKGLYAFILDTSVQSFKPKPSSLGRISGRVSGRRKSSFATDAFSKSSIPYSKSIGPSFSFLNYSVQTAGDERSSQEIFYGLKASGGGGLISFPLDISLHYSPTSPSLFDSFTEDHSGSIFVLDTSLPLEWKKGVRWSVYAILGLTLTRSDFDLVISGQSEPSSETKFGVNGGFGGGYRFGRYILKLEGKYYMTGADHFGAALSLQRLF